MAETDADKLTALPDVAKKIHMECKKCGCERYFTVIAHVDEKSAKTECEVCKAKKTFKLKSAKKTKATGTRRTRANTPEKVWQKIYDEKGADNPVAYTIKGNFEADTVLDHPKFGLGFVTESNGLKIQVTFKEGTKELIHNR